MSKLAFIRTDPVSEKYITHSGNDTNSKKHEKQEPKLCSRNFANLGYFVNLANKNFQLHEYLHKKSIGFT